MSSPADAASLSGTVTPYHRHVFVCTGPAAWPARLEEADGLLGRMARDVHARREGPGAWPKLSATDEPSAGAGLDLLVFPDRVRYHGVDESAWEAILQDQLEGAGVCPSARSTPLSGCHVFVCIHGARDERCGKCGPPLLAAFRDAVGEAGDVTVRATSHVGGHKYAANVLVYPAGAWYGYATPADAPRILAHHLDGGPQPTELLRGTMLPLPALSGVIS
ncbi:MAG: sucrase/ferredoxin-like family protein [Gemmatimonadota bacterium]